MAFGRRDVVTDLQGKKKTQHRTSKGMKLAWHMDVQPQPTIIDGVGSPDWIWFSIFSLIFSAHKTKEPIMHRQRAFRGMLFSLQPYACMPPMTGVPTCGTSPPHTTPSPPLSRLLFSSLLKIRLLLPTPLQWKFLACCFGE